MGMGDLFEYRKIGKPEGRIVLYNCEAVCIVSWDNFGYNRKDLQ